MTKTELLQAGFTESEVNSYFAGQRETLSEAGFSQQEINTHFGQQTAILERPDEAHKKGIEIQDMSVDLELPIEDIESNYNTIMEIPDPDDVPLGIKAPKKHIPDEKPFEQIRIGAAPPKTTWQKIKGFFVTDRPSLPPNADRIEKISRAFDIAVGTPLRTFLKFAKGRTFGADELMWAGLKRITPDSMWVDEVKDMTLDEAMDWSAGYNPSGFVKMTGDIAEFIGRLGTAKGIGVKTGLLGKMPKDISVLLAAGETAKLFGIAAVAEQVSKAVATKIDPTETEYGYEGPTAVLRDMAIGAVLSIANSGIKVVWTKLTPTEQTRALKILGLKKGATPQEITVASRKWEFKYHPDKAKGFVSEFQEVIKARNLLRQGEVKDIVFRGQKVIIKPKLLPGEVKQPVQPPTERTVAPKVGVKPEKGIKVPPKPIQAKPEAKKAKGRITREEFEAIEAARGKAITEEDRITDEFATQIGKQLKNTGVRIKPTSIGILRANWRGGWVDNDDVFTFYANQAIGKEERIELEKALPENVKVFSGGIDFPKSLVTAPTPSALEEKAVKTVPQRVAEVRQKIPDAKLSRKPVTVGEKIFHPVALPTEKIGVDAAKFQFKLGARLKGGVTEALKDVERFDPIKGGQILVWQDKAGKYWVVDGHHRVALAKKTKAASLETWVIREADGWSEADARAEGALRNLADGKGTAIDAAKLFRDSNITLENLRKQGVPTNNTIVQQGMDMKDLSSEVFELVIDERLPANMAAAIGKRAKGDAQQKQVADMILEGEVDTLRQAELLAATIDTAPVLTKSEQTLFGLETTEKSLFAERAKILANVEKKLKTNKKVFGVLATQTGIIEAKGNVLAKVENLLAKEQAEEILFMLEKLANAKGPVAEALNDATKEYAKNPTKENLTKVTIRLLEQWTEGPTRLRIPGGAGVQQLPLEGFGKEVGGFLDVEPLQKSFNAVLNILEPAKLTEIKLGKDVSAIPLVGIAGKPDVARIEFNEKTLDTLDVNLEEFGKKLGTYSNRVLELLMLSRGKPASAEAIAIRNDALKSLAKEAPELVGTRKMITKIADFNYKFLTEVVGDEINYVTDYFYGIYKDTKKVDRFLDFWKTTKRFTKEKKLPTVADAKAYGLDLRDPNPVNNLRSEYMAISRLDGMIWMRDELLRTGEDLYISKDPAIIADAEKIPEPVFKGLWFDPVLAKQIKSLISTNKIARVPVLNALRKTNNFFRSIKFMFSAFHHLVIAKQAIADSGYLGFLYKKTALRGFTLGFKKNDPRFKTAEYKDYIEHLGGHRFSIASEAERAFVGAIDKLTSPIVAKAGALGTPGKMVAKLAISPITIPKGYVKWLFENYIPEVKYTKYLDFKNEMTKKLGRELTRAEKIEIVKEGQNFYGMMNERIFGRSGTVTTLLRVKFMAPMFATGNFRSSGKAMTQWGQEGTWNAGRSRANIVNSLLLTAIAATIGTLAVTGTWPKKPETAADIRDLFKIDTGKRDSKGRKIMVDLMTYDRDYWTIFGKPLVGQAGEVPAEVLRRLGGMTATTFEVISDLNQLSMGKAIYDWKGDRVVEVTDPFLKRALGLIAFETQKVTPISVNVFWQSRQRNLTRLAAAVSALSGFRPTTSEKDRRESQIIGRIFSLRDRQERLFHFLGSIKNPRKHIDTYNKIAQSVLDNPITTNEMKRKWAKNLVIDTERLIANKVHSHELLRVSEKPKPDELERAKKWLTNFEVAESQFRKHLIVYEMKHRKLITEMKVGDADDMLKQEIARFYADKGILGRKVAGGTATDEEKRLSRKFEKLSSNISTIGARLNKTTNIAERKRFYERIKSVIERAAD